VKPRQFEDVIRPGARRVDHEGRFDVIGFSGNGVPCHHAADASRRSEQFGDFHMRQALGAVLFRVAGVFDDQEEGIDGSVRHTHRRDEGGIDRRVHLQDVVPLQRLRLDADVHAGADERVPPVQAVFRQRNEEAPRRFDAVGGDGFENTVFRDAFPGRFAVGDDITRAAVEKAVIPSRGAAGEVSPFQQYGRNPAQRQVPGDARPGGTAAYDHDLGLEMHERGLREMT